MKLDPHKRSVECLRRLEEFHRRIVSQEEAVEAINDRIERISAGLCEPGKPLGVFLMLGPTGTGKTEMAKVTSSIIHRTDDPRMMRVDCGEFQHSHDISKLIGSPPGYLGHRDTRPYLSTTRLLGATSEHSSVSVILFDEIEKASDALWNLLLGIFDRGMVTLGDNKKPTYQPVLYS